MACQFLSIAIFATALTLGACNNSAPEGTSQTALVDEKLSQTVSVETPSRSVESTSLLDPNTVTVADLRKYTRLDDLDPTVIDAMMAARPFETAQALDIFLKEYLGDEARVVLYTQMFMPMDLNSTPEADFMIIPGVGKKMAHEFEEYRPYTDMAQFDREISKHVDDEELARLKRYVIIK